MYTIGQISKQVHLSIDAIRYYDSINLIKPAHINPENGYRYYSADQIESFLFITELKAFDFSLDAIRELLDCKDISRLNAALVSKIRQLENQMSETSSIIRAIHRRLSPKSDSNRVLIVDDSDFMRMMQRDILTTHHYDLVAEAKDGGAAIEKFKHHKPDFVVMNYDMPIMNGLEASSQIIHQDPNSKIMLCTKASTLDHVLKAVEIGILDVVAKPFNMERFLESLESHLTPRKFIPERMSEIQAGLSQYGNITLNQVAIDSIYEFLYNDATPMNLSLLQEYILNIEAHSDSVSPSI